MITVWGGAPTKIETGPSVIIPHPAKELGLATINPTHKEKMVVKFDLSKFSKEEITVKTEDGFLVVEGDHKEKCDSGRETVRTTRFFRRRVPLPLHANEDALVWEYMGAFYGNMKVTIPHKILPGSGKFAFVRRNSVLGVLGLPTAAAAAGTPGPAPAPGRNRPPLLRRASTDAIGLKNNHPGNIHNYATGPDDTGMECTNDTFVVRLKVPEFSPKDITVKTVDDFLMVECSHKEKQEGNEFIARTFKRRYHLPINANKEALLSRLSFDGLLKVKVPRKLTSGGKEKVHQLVVVTEEEAGAKD